MKRAKATTISRAMPLISLILLTTPTALLAATQFEHLEGSPDLRSASALVTGAGGEVIYGKDIDTEQMLKDDYMLYEALNLLKGLAILQARIQ